MREWTWRKATKVSDTKVKMERGTFEVLHIVDWRLMPFWRTHATCCEKNCNTTTVYVFGFAFMYTYEARTLDPAAAISAIFGQRDEDDGDEDKSKEARRDLH